MSLANLPWFLAYLATTLVLTLIQRRFFNRLYGGAEAA